jgi:hypothetical protein
MIIPAQPGFELLQLCPHRQPNWIRDPILAWFFHNDRFDGGLPCAVTVGGGVTWVRTGRCFGRAVRYPDGQVVVLLDEIVSETQPDLDDYVLRYADIEAWLKAEGAVMDRHLAKMAVLAQDLNRESK